ncbi:MAG: nucleoside triphosphate pyrophosphohydrolase, partial [Bacteroidetes bacterium]|nr:nucleoside triphosphate pyrophosphohydrolase [Bacteroidota bacterium]
RRFQHIEERLDAQAKAMTDVDLAEMDQYWEEAKAAE